MDISGKVAVVTGGASGLGAATAKMIVEEGGHVVIVDLNDQAGHALAKDLGSHARFVRADVSDPAEAQAAVAAGRGRRRDRLRRVLVVGLGRRRRR